jgi:ABC-type multidrug transport system fused ATPase/permease subunit
VLTLLIISSTTLFSTIHHYVTTKPLRQGWNLIPPNEELSNDQDGDLINRNYPSLLWSIALGVLAILGCAMQVALAVEASRLRPSVTLSLLSWILLLLFITLKRPRYCPWSLLLFYLSALVTEAAKPNSWPSTTLNTLGVTTYGTIFSAIISIVIVLCMQLRPVAYPSEIIRTYGSAPSSKERSPEDSLRLWQFLTFSWAWPLLAIGKERPIDPQDVWARVYELRNEYVAKTRSSLGDLPLVRKVLKENAVDSGIVVMLSLVSLSCGKNYAITQECLPLTANEYNLEMASPLLLQQLLLAMKSSVNRENRVIVYAILILARGLLSAQTTALHNWYSRRCFERTSSELIISIHEKAMSRKVSNSFRGQVNRVDTLRSNHNPEREFRSESVKPKKWALLIHVWKEICSSHKMDPVKPPAVSASSGQILNLVRSDTYEIARLFSSIGRLLRAPFGAVSTILILWHLLGPWCLFGVVVILVGLVLNGAIVRLRLRQQRRSKIAGDSRVQINSEFIDAVRHLRWYAWVEPWLTKVMIARQTELNARLVTSFLNTISSFIMLLAGSFMPITAFFAYTAIGSHPLTIDLIFPALQLFTSLQFRMYEIPGLFTQLMSAFVALDRIEAFINETDKEAHGNSIDLVNEKLALQDCSFSWPGSPETIISGASLAFGRGLTIIYGPAGSGKTALISTLLNEMDIRSGQCVLSDEPVAYCPQTSWLQSVSIRDNILFHSPYEEDRYQKVLNACALNPDLMEMEHGDLSQIGEG